MILIQRLQELLMEVNLLLVEFVQAQINDIKDIVEK
jgi:hypothetical protein